MSSARQKGKLYRLEPRLYQYIYGSNEPVLRARSGDSVTASIINTDGFDQYGSSETSQE